MKAIPEMYPQQKEGFSKTATLPVAALLMEQRTGKSRIIVEQLRYLKEQVNCTRLLIICPGTVKNQWAKEVFEEHMVEDYVSFIFRAGGGKTKIQEFKAFNEAADKGKYAIFVAHYEAFAFDEVVLYLRQFMLGKEALIALDESQNIRGQDAKRTQNIIALFKSRKFKRILTGTPINQNPMGLWAQFEFLQPGLLPSNYFKMRKHHVVMVTDVNPMTGRPFDRVVSRSEYEAIHKQLRRFEEKNGKLTSDILETMAKVFHISEADAMHICQNERYTPYKNLEEILKAIEPITYFKRREDCGYFTKKVYNTLTVEPSPEQAKAIKGMIKDWAATEGGDIITAKNAMVAIMRVQQIAGGIYPYQEPDPVTGELVVKKRILSNNPKIKALIDYMDELEDSTIVWSRFKDEGEEIAKALMNEGHESRHIDSDTPDHLREQWITEFKARKLQVLVMSPHIGGEGLNLAVCKLQVFYSNDYRADKRLQCEDRSISLEDNLPPLYIDITMEGSWDKVILDALKAGEDLIETFRGRSLAQLLGEESK